MNLDRNESSPQCYENFVVQNIWVDNEKATLIQIKPWSQYFDPQGQPEPTSNARNVRISGVEGQLGVLRVIKGNAQSHFGSIIIEDVNVDAKSTKFELGENVIALELNDVVLNGTAFVTE